MLDKLLDLQVSVLHLQLIHIGRTVKSLCYGDGCVAAVAKRLLEKWRHLVVAAVQPVDSRRPGMNSVYLCSLHIFINGVYEFIDDQRTCESEQQSRPDTSSTDSSEPSRALDTTISMPLLADPNDDTTTTSNQRPPVTFSILAGRRRIDNNPLAQSSSGTTTKPNPSTIYRRRPVTDSILASRLANELSSQSSFGSVNSSNSSAAKTKTKAERERALQRAPLMRKSLKLVNLYRKRCNTLKCLPNNEKEIS